MEKIDEKMHIGVHVSHCCIIHGCKYGDEKCPVVIGIFKQDYPCEECMSDGIKTVKEVIDVYEGMVNTCPHCGHVI